MLKRILLVTHWYYPQNNPRAFRAYELSMELLRQGYEVDIIIGSRKALIPSDSISDFVESMCPSNNERKSTTESQKISASKTKLSVYESLVKPFIKFFIGERFIFTHLNTIKKLMKMNKYEAVISIGIPFYVHIATALSIKKSLKKSISICDNGDPFYHYNGRNDKAIYFKWIQKAVLRKFDYICVPINSAVDYYSEYVGRNRIKVIPQGFDFSSISLKEYKRNEIPTFAYAGVFYEDIRNPLSFFEYLDKLNIDFRFILFTPSEGPVYHKIISRYKRKLGDKLIINSILPRERCIYELSGMDFLINFENTNSIQLPSKLIDYTLTKRPILSFNQMNIPDDTFIKFTIGNYEGSVVVDIDFYDIKSVCKQFCYLFEKSEGEV